MRNTAILSIFAAALLFTSCNNTSENSSESSELSTKDKILVPEAKEDGVPYYVVPQESQVSWEGKKMTGAHNGAVIIKEGSLAVKDDKVTGGTIVLDMTTITNADLTDATDNQKLVGHLKSDDFFGVEKFPHATFTFDKTTYEPNTEAGKPNYTVEGTLTIKDKTDQVSFPAFISVENGVARAKGDIKIDRSKFDVRYGS
ncbi:MAG: YceI family protein, partial [Chitinophagaceae bacterium]